MKLVQNACLLRLPKDYSSVMSLSVLNGYEWFHTRENSPPTLFKNFVAEMKQNRFF